MRPPHFPYDKIAASVLPGWEISLAFVEPPQARKLNKELRHKNYIPNVLSYKVGNESGEIIICLKVAKKQASSYGLSVSKFVLYLFIHGLLHLEGRRHGTTMEKREQALLAEWGNPALPNGSPHRNRNRHRHVPSKVGRRRGAAR